MGNIINGISMKISKLYYRSNKQIAMRKWIKIYYSIFWKYLSPKMRYVSFKRKYDLNVASLIVPSSSTNHSTKIIYRLNNWIALCLYLESYQITRSVNSYHRKLNQTLRSTNKQNMSYMNTEYAAYHKFYFTHIFNFFQISYLEVVTLFWNSVLY